MAEKLPKFLDPSRLADQRSTLAGTMPASALTRLGDQYEVVDAVAATLNFAKDARGRIEVSGEITTTLQALCQRCLQAMRVEIAQPVRSLLVDGAVIDEVVAETDIDCVEFADRLDLYALIEDEIVLACPIVPQHLAGECQTPLDASNHGAEPATDGGHDKPFAGLAALLKGDKPE